MKIHKLLTQVSSSKASIFRDVKKAICIKYIKKREDIKFVLEMHPKNRFKYYKSMIYRIVHIMEPVKLPYMIIVMIGGLNFDRDVNQIRIETPRSMITQEE